MGTCKTCKHWKVTVDENDNCIIKPWDFETMKPITQEFEVRYCRSPKLFFFQRPMMPTEACLVDGSEYKAALITGPKFGCVNYEPVLPVSELKV